MRWVWIVTGMLAAVSAAWGEPLHERIDRHIEARLDGLSRSGLADDAEFQRRVHLDLAGRIPSAEGVSRFLADPAPDKRARLIDDLLAGPDYPRRMQECFHVMLMERRGEHPEWLAFLYESFAANKPWDVLAGQILAPNGADAANRGAAFFYVNRLDKVGQNATDHPGLTRDVGRLFAGRDLQCAQCHDHLFVDDYDQADFQGLYTIFLNVVIRSDVKFPAVAENLMQKKQEFMSVFEKVKKETGPRIPGGAEIEIPSLPKGQEYLMEPDRKSRTVGVPRFSPLAELARHLPTAENPAFCRNIVNRLWFIMMGRGLVHPLDLDHSDNPPSHPEVLNLLASEFAGQGFDIKWLVRELALTRTYQRSSQLPEGMTSVPAPQTYQVALEKRMSAEQVFWSVLEAMGQRERLLAEKSATRMGKRPAGAATGSRLDDLRDRFLKAYANPAGEPEEEPSPELKAALFLMNDAVFRELLQPHSGNLIDRLVPIDEPGRLARELFLAVLGRLPTAEDEQDVREHLQRNSHDRPASIRQLAWALLASTEFGVNH